MQDMEPTEKTTKPLYKRRWLQVIAGLGVLFLLFIILLPFGIRYALVQLILQQGVQSAQIEDVDFNLFTGELQISNLQIKRKDESTLQLPKIIANADWTPLLKKRAVVPSILLQGLDIWIDQDTNGKLQIGGIPLPKSRARTEPQQGKVHAWGFGFSDIAIGDSTLHLRLPVQTADIHIDRLHMTRFQSWLKDDHAELKLSGEYNKAKFDLQAQLRLFADEPTITGTLDIKAFELANLAPLVSGYLPKIDGRVAIDSTFRLAHTPKKQSSAELDLSAQLDNLALQYNDDTIQQDKFNWKGKITAQLNDRFQLQAIDADGSIASENLQVSLPRPVPIHYAHAGLNWDGKLHLEPADIARLRLNANMRGKQIVVSGNHQQVLFRGDELLLAGLTAAGTQEINAQSLQLKGLAVLDGVTQSGKARKARKYGIRIVQERVFWNALELEVG